LDEELATFGGGEWEHDFDVLRAEVGQLTKERDEARRLQGKLRAEIGQFAKERDEARRLQGELRAEIGQLTEERDEARRLHVKLTEERDEAGHLQGELRAEIGQLTEERDEARRLHGKLALDGSATATDLERALGELRHAFRVSMLRHVPNITHEEIDRVLASCAVLKSEEGPIEGSLTTTSIP
jgi:uncharacterized coiled-coil DUF342 family protein